MEIGFFTLIHRGVQDELAIDQTHLDRGRRTGEGQVRNGQHDGGSHHGGDFRRVVLFHGHDRRHHLDIVAEALGEQGPDWPVDEPGVEDGLFRWAAFPFQKPTGDLAYGVLFFFIVHGQREEVHAFPGFLGNRYNAKDAGVAVAHHGRALCELGDLADFDFEGSSGDFHFKYSH